MAAPDVDAPAEPTTPDIPVWTDAAPAGKSPVPPRARPSRRVVAPPAQGGISRIESLRELAAMGTVIALPVAAGATYANLGGYEYGRLFVFGVMFGLAAGLTMLDLRGLPRARLPILGSLAGMLLLAATPLLGFGGAGLAATALPMMFGSVALIVSAWRLRGSRGLSIPWVSGLLLLSILAAAPLALASPGETATVQWVVAGGLALGPAGLVTGRRYLRRLADARLGRADEEYARRDFIGAVSTYDQAIRLARRAGRETPAGWYGKGAALVAAGKPEEAVIALDRALALSPANEIAWINKGTALSHLGRLNDALKCYNSAIKVNPAYEVAWNNKGNALARLGKHDIALACYNRALEIDESYRTAWVNKGFVLAKLGRFEEAAACADTALRITTGAAASG